MLSLSTVVNHICLCTIELADATLKMWSPACRHLHVLSSYKCIQKYLPKPTPAHGIAGGGYLANLSPSEFSQHYEEGLPEQMAGADFTAECGAHWDAATQARLLPGCANSAAGDADSKPGAHDSSCAS